MAFDQPRYLDRRAGRSYTEEPMFKMRGEAEPVDEQTQERITADARRRFADERQHELFLRDARSRSVKLRNLCNEARRLNVDARRELGAIDSQLELLARKVSQRRASMASGAS